MQNQYIRKLILLHTRSIFILNKIQHKNQVLSRIEVDYDTAIKDNFKSLYKYKINIIKKSLSLLSYAYEIMNKEIVKLKKDNNGAKIASSY